MTQTAVKSSSFSELIEVWLDDGRRYELVNGQIIKITANRARDDIALEKPIQLAVGATSTN